jgi:hypothetical protein
VRQEQRGRRPGITLEDVRVTREAGRRASSYISEGLQIPPPHQHPGKDEREECALGTYSCTLLTGWAWAGSNDNNPEYQYYEGSRSGQTRPLTP